MSLRDADINRHLEMLRGDLTASFGSSTDKHFTRHVTGNTFKHEVDVRRGRIQLAMPKVGWYRVAVEGLAGILPCCRLSTAGSALLAPVETTALPADCAVFVAIHKGGLWGYILGVIPPVTIDSNYCFSDFVFQGSHAGFYDEYLSSYLTLTADYGGVIDFSNNKPIDNLSLDWGITTTTGVSVHIDPMMGYLRVSEACGVFCFYPENLLRVTGRTLQVESDIHYAEYTNDEGESNIYYGEAAFPWEARGLLSHSEKPNREIEDEAVILTRIHGKLEPVEDTIEPIHRYEEFGGYIGQGRIRQMSVPEHVGESTPRTYNNTAQNSICVFREHIGLEGSWNVSTAKSLRLCRQVFLAQPRRLRQTVDVSEEADSTTNDNYKASGLLHEGDPHHPGDLYSSDGFTVILGALDRLTYETNSRDLLGFYYHSKSDNKGDFKLAEITEPWQTPLSFSELRSGQGFTQSVLSPKELLIDERRETKTKFARLLQMLEFTDDGGVILQGGHGEQIVFTRGEIYIDAPSNIHVRSGKQTVILAGDDAIVRAVNSVDVSTAKRDIRLKAEGNQHLLAGNSGKGGLLLESRSTGDTQDYPAEGGEAINSSGIVLKANKSSVVSFSSGLYLRTGGTNAGLGSGKIVLDAARGDQDIVMLASTHRRFAKSSFNDEFGDSLEKITASNTFARTGARLTGYVQLNGSLSITQSLGVRNGITITRGHIASRSGGTVGIAAPNADATLQAVDVAQEAALATAKVYYQGYNSEYYEGSALGSDKTIKAVSFSCRSDTDYNTKTLKIPQAYWQRLAGSSAATEAWTEPAVTYQGKDVKTYPWPGTNWTKANFLVMDQSDHIFYDLDTGKPRNRSYPAQPAFGRPQAKIPAQAYTVIKS